MARVTPLFLLVGLCSLVIGAAANASQSQPICSSLIGLAAAKGSQSKFNVYINGAFRQSVSGRLQGVIAPFNGSTVYEVPVCTQQEIDEAFQAARVAQKSWSRTPLWQRAELLKKAAAKLREHADEIAEVMLNEVAKPRKAALQEVLRTADIFEYTAEEGVRVAGTLLNSDSFPGEKRNKLALVTRVPLGVIVAIPPYNYPLNLAGSKVAPALISGNALVMKPPSQVLLRIRISILSCRTLALHTSSSSSSSSCVLAKARPSPSSLLYQHAAKVIHSLWKTLCKSYTFWRLVLWALRALSFSNMDIIVCVLPTCRDVGGGGRHIEREIKIGRKIQGRISGCID